MSFRRTGAPVLAALALATTAACGTGTTGSGSRSGSTSDAGAGSGSHPVTVRNCGADVTFDRAPERAVLLKSASVPFLDAIGALDSVTARAGLYPPEYYGERTRKALDGIPALTDKVDSTGHLQISKETVIAQRPDLVVGEVANLSRATLGAVGVPLLEEPALCPEGVDAPDFEDVADQLRMWGTVFGRSEQATAAVSTMEKRLASLTVPARTSGSRTAAVLYPTVGGGVTYAYGSRSMATAQLEAAGFENVFGGVDERVFEITPEELLGRNPDVLVLLHNDGDPAKVVAAVTALPGASKLRAVQDEAVMPLLFNFTEPPSPLTLDGLERIIERFPADS